MTVPEYSPVLDSGQSASVICSGELRAEGIGFASLVKTTVPIASFLLNN
jgi:hypothetical protein